MYGVEAGGVRGVWDHKEVHYPDVSEWVAAKSWGYLRRPEVLWLC